MKTNIVLLALCLLCAAAGCAKKQTPATVTTPDGSATFWVPGAGQWEAEPLSSEPGSLEQHIYSVEYGWNSAFIFGYIDQSDEPMDYSLVNARDGAVGSAHGVVLSSKKITYGPEKFEGIEYTFKGKSEGEKVAGRGRMYVIDGQFYQMLAITVGGTPPDSKFSKKFFRSFNRKMANGKAPENDSDSVPEEG